VQHIENLPSLLNTADGSRILSNRGHSLKDGCPIIPLESGAPHHYNGLFGLGKDLKCKTKLYQKLTLE